MNEITRRNRARWPWAGVFALLVAALPSGAVEIRLAPGANAGRIDILRGELGPFAQSGSNAERGALKTDSESQDLLERARIFAEEKRFDLATRLWEEVLGKTSDAVFTREDWKRRSLEHEYQLFRPASSIVERTLLDMPEAGLKAYRERVDGEAKAILRRAPANERELALGEVVRRYFVSSIGDDAAFELACRKLDHHEFFPASRLLSKILNDHPDSDVPKAELLSRLAYINARVGDASLGQNYLRDLDALGDASKDSRFRLLREEIRRLAKERQQGLVGGGGDQSWRMTGGNPSRSGLMPDPDFPEGGAAPGFVEGWTQMFKLKVPSGWPSLGGDVNPFFELSSLDTVEIDGAQMEEQAANAVRRWQAAGLRPVGQMAIGGGSVYFKTNDRLVRARASDGTLEWVGHRNSYVFDQQTQSLMRPRSTILRGGDPIIQAPDPVSVAAFGDRVHPTVCLAGNIVVAYQGAPLDFIEPSAIQDLRPEIIQFNRINPGAIPTSPAFRENRLVAYDQKSGRLLWQRRFADGPALAIDSPMGRSSLGFAGPPAPYGSLIVAPVIRNGALWVYAFDSADGAIRWHTLLTAMPFQMRPRPVAALAIDGGEIYVGAGTGHVFSLDGLTGSLNWAASYPRTMVGVEPEIIVNNNNLRFRGQIRRPPSAKLVGFSEDTVVPHGALLIVAASDYDYLFALDRRSGQFVWETPMTPFEKSEPSSFVVGVSKGLVHLAGKSVVRAYEIEGGRFAWETSTGVTTGRPCLTGENIFLPCGQEIVKLSVGTGSQAGTFRVSSGVDEPVGNLFSDGKRLFVFGFEKVYSLNYQRPTDEGQ